MSVNLFRVARALSGRAGTRLLFVLVAACHALLAAGCVVLVDLGQQRFSARNAASPAAVPSVSSSRTLPASVDSRGSDRSFANKLLPSTVVLVTLSVGVTCSFSRRWTWWAWLMAAVAVAPLAIRTASLNAGLPTPLHNQWWFMLGGSCLFAFAMAWSAQLTPRRHHTDLR